MPLRPDLTKSFDLVSLHPWSVGLEPGGAGPGQGHATDFSLLHLQTQLQRSSCSWRLCLRRSLLNGQRLLMLKVGRDDFYLIVGLSVLQHRAGPGCRDVLKLNPRQLMRSCVT